MPKPIYILNGPNLNLLGTREPEIYGVDTLEDIEIACITTAKQDGYDIVFKQSNIEGELVDMIQEARDKACALIINPAAYTHTSVAIHDALKALDIPSVEIHLSQPAKRESFRRRSLGYKREIFMASTPKKTAGSTDTKLVRELAKILNDTGLTEIEMEKGSLKIRVAKGGGTVVQAMAAPAPQATTAPASQPVAAPAAKTESADAAAHPGAVKSPMVGTVYTRPSPDADSFVKVGDKVKEGDTIVLIEAMKTFNPITATKSGKIEAVLIEDAQPVEFGEALFIIV